jgi:DNA-binding PadR family transcriptional regulator
LATNYKIVAKKKRLVMSQPSREMRERIIRSFMDLIILKELRTREGMSGYEVTAILHKRFHTLPSPGSVYSVLYGLEKKGLIECSTNSGKKVYKLTKKGNEETRKNLHSLNGILLMIKTILSDNSLL